MPGWWRAILADPCQCSQFPERPNVTARHLTSIKSTIVHGHTAHTDVPVHRDQPFAWHSTEVWPTRLSWNYGKGPRRRHLPDQSDSVNLLPSTSHSVNNIVALGVDHRKALIVGIATVVVLNTIEE